MWLQSKHHNKTVGMKESPLRHKLIISKWKLTSMLFISANQSHQTDTLKYINAINEANMTACLWQCLLSDLIDLLLGTSNQKCTYTGMSRLQWQVDFTLSVVSYGHFARNNTVTLDPIITKNQVGLTHPPLILSSFTHNRRQQGNVSECFYGVVFEFVQIR